VAAEATRWRFIGRVQVRGAGWGAEEARAHAAGFRALELGHHEAALAGEVDLLLPLRQARRLQPLRGRLDGGLSREWGNLPHDPVDSEPYSRS
jgi:hypothetical protein